MLKTSPHKVMADNAGALESHRNRETGTVVTVYDAEQAGLDYEDGEYATVCEDHGAICNHASKHRARLWAASPDGLVRGLSQLVRGQAHMNHKPGYNCNALNQYLVTGGVACGDCGASSVPLADPADYCTETCADGKPCPLPRDEGRDLCWVHRIQNGSTK